ncbi:MAG: phosphatase PAP2 family protein [Candidatus Delongbacteria bacterium]|nr:phosphatase PAP2 family protein [Candidatus Delongbacteria bacterium]MBN2836331.1 phosphatase PAP2 family protein [Candidatus Delongbacteria bacterium]
MVEKLKNLDRDFFVFLNKDLHFDCLNDFFSTITNQAYAFIPVLIIIIFLVKKYKAKSVYIIVGAAIAVGLSDFITSGIVKKIVMRPRPCETIDNIYFWAKNKNPHWIITDLTEKSSYKKSFSFPSSHAANTMAMAVFISFFYKKLLFILVPFSILIGYSRVYVGVHYPSDVVAGFVFGIFISFFVKYLYDIIYDKLSRK